MYKRIYVPIDGTDVASRGLKEAISLANDQALLRVVYVLQEIYPLVNEPIRLTDYDTIRESAKNFGETALEQAAITAQFAGKSIETALVEAEGQSIASALMSDAEHWQADLIVIGTHGRVGINRLVMGSVAGSLVHLSLIPVLLVRTA